MDITLADTDVQDVQSNQGVVGFEVTNASIGEPSQHISSWNVDPQSSPQSASTSTDTPSMLSPALTHPIDGDEACHRGSRSPPAFGTINFNASVESFLSHLFTHSWQILTTYSISNLCAYIDRTPTAHINLSKWCKELTGVPHEFLLLQVEGPQTKRFWLRIERRPRRKATLSRLMSSRSPSDDTAQLSTSLHSLFASKSEVIVETNFRHPPSLHDLSIILSILGEESPMYKLWPQNCFFFCSIIYEHLFSIGRGVNTSGVPSKLSLSLAPNVRATINRRVMDSLSVLSASLGHMGAVIPASSTSSIDPFVCTVRTLGVMDCPVATLCGLLRSNPATRNGRIHSLVRRRRTRGLRHEFILLRVRIPNMTDLWIRLERTTRARAGSPVTSLLHWDLPTNDTCKISEKDSNLTDDVSFIAAIVEFGTPPSLDNLERLLTIISEESKTFNLLKENCWFYTATIQDVLTNWCDGVLRGTLSHLKYGWEARDRIRARRDEIMNPSGGV